MIASVALQKAIFAALDGEITGDVYDEVPRDAVPPYTVIGETPAESPWDTHDSEGSEEFVMLHVWSHATGSVEVKTIAAEIDDELHYAELELETGELVQLRREFMTILKEEVRPGEVWRHAAIRYRAWITD